MEILPQSIDLLIIRRFNFRFAHLICVLPFFVVSYVHIIELKWYAVLFGDLEGSILGLIVKSPLKSLEAYLMFKKFHSCCTWFRKSVTSMFVGKISETNNWHCSQSSILHKIVA